MPMNPPQFTNRPERLSRLQENYDEGLTRETIPTATREQLDKQCLVVTDAKLMFLFQNAMESYSKSTKNQKVTEYNAAHGIGMKM